MQQLQYIVGEIAKYGLSAGKLIDPTGASEVHLKKNRFIIGTNGKVPGNQVEMKNFLMIFACLKTGFKEAWDVFLVPERITRCRMRLIPAAAFIDCPRI
jgi:hypothetical protein